MSKVRWIRQFSWYKAYPNKNIQIISYFIKLVIGLLLKTQKSIVSFIGVWQIKRILNMYVFLIDSFLDRNIAIKLNFSNVYLILIFLSWFNLKYLLISYYFWDGCFCFQINILLLIIVRVCALFFIWLIYHQFFLCFVMKS